MLNFNNGEVTDTNFFFSIEAKAFYVGYETDATRGAVIFYPELLCLITISPLFSGVESILVKHD